MSLPAFLRAFVKALKSVDREDFRQKTDLVFAASFAVQFFVMALLPSTKFHLKGSNV